MNIFKSFHFSLAKSRPKILAPASDQILNLLQLQPKNLSPDRLRNTAYCTYFRTFSVSDPQLFSEQGGGEPRNTKNFKTKLNILLRNTGNEYM